MNDKALALETVLLPVSNKIKLKLSDMENQFFCGFIIMTMENPITNDTALEQCVLMSFFEKNFKKITLIKSGKYNLTAAEAIAFKRLLFYTTMRDQADVIRNKIIGYLHQKITYF